MDMVGMEVVCTGLTVGDIVVVGMAADMADTDGMGVEVTEDTEATVTMADTEWATVAAMEAMEYTDVVDMEVTEDMEVMEDTEVVMEATAAWDTEAGTQETTTLTMVTVVDMDMVATEAVMEAMVVTEEVDTEAMAATGKSSNVSRAGTSLTR